MVLRYIISTTDDKQLPAAAFSYFSNMKPLFTLLVLWCGITHGSAQQKTPLNIGVEQDVLPYVTGGYFFGAWAGKGHTRVRCILARVHKPDFIIRKGFTNNRVTAYAITADYFLKRSWRGWWLSTGLVYWKNTIQADTRINTAAFNTTLINGSIGYNVVLWKDWYLSPWMGMHIQAGGPSTIMVDNQAYRPPLLNPEASLKLGWYF